MNTRETGTLETYLIPRENLYPIGFVDLDHWPYTVSELSEVTINNSRSTYIRKKGRRSISKIVFRTLAIILVWLSRRQLVDTKELLQ